MTSLSRCASAMKVSCCSDVSHNLVYSLAGVRAGSLHPSEKNMRLTLSSGSPLTCSECSSILSSHALLSESSSSPVGERRP